MDEIGMWVKNIICFSLLMSAFLQLPVGKEYLRYLKIFGGFVLILLTLSPVIRFLDSEGKWDFLLDLQSIKQERYDYEKQILLGDTAREHAIRTEYEAAIAKKVQELVEGKGYEVVACEVKVEGEGENVEYGSIKQIILQAKRGVGWDKALQSEKNAGQAETIPSEQKEDPAEETKKQGIDKISVPRIEIGIVETEWDYLESSNRVSSVEEILLAEHLAAYFGMQADRVTVRISG